MIVIYNFDYLLIFFMQQIYATNFPALLTRGYCRLKPFVTPISLLLR